MRQHITQSTILILGFILQTASAAQLEVGEYAFSSDMTLLDFAKSGESSSSASGVYYQMEAGCKINTLKIKKRYNIKDSNWIEVNNTVSSGTRTYMGEAGGYMGGISGLYLWFSGICLKENPNIKVWTDMPDQFIGGVQYVFHVPQWQHYYKYRKTAAARVEENITINITQPGTAVFAAGDVQYLEYPAEVILENQANNKKIRLGASNGVLSWEGQKNAPAGIYRGAMTVKLRQP